LQANFNEKTTFWVWCLYSYFIHGRKDRGRQGVLPSPQQIYLFLAAPLSTLHGSRLQIKNPTLPSHLVAWASTPNPSKKSCHLREIGTRDKPSLLGFTR
jgi:hypothetical protein